MSVENHPNFHAVQFTTDLLAAFKAALRGDARYEAIPSDAIMPLVLETVERAEWLANASAVAAAKERDTP